MWISKDEDGRANEILSNFRGKKFVLLLDNVWEQLDLSKVGISYLLDDDNQTGSKNSIYNPVRKGMWCVEDSEWNVSHQKQP